MSDISNEEFIKILHARNKLLAEKTRKFSSITAALTSTLAIALSVGMFSATVLDKKKFVSNSELAERLQTLEDSVKSRDKEISASIRQLEEAKKQIESISKVPENAEWKSSFTDVNQKIDIVTARLSALEGALTVDPAKSLAVPILRKDLDNTEKSLRGEIAQTKSEIDRIYDQNKWFIGLMFTIAISVLGMAVSGYANRKET